MNRKTSMWSTKAVALLCSAAALAAATRVLADDDDKRTERLNGLIDDYSAQNGVSPLGPWQIHGEWSLQLQRKSTKAEFSAAIAMELSDYSRTPSDIDNPALRSPHTHHIAMHNASVEQSPSGCNGLQVTGTASVTGNGNPAPFESMGPSTLKICVTGGSEVQYSNVTLTFAGPATVHFGTIAIHGVVKTRD